MFLAALLLCPMALAEGFVFDGTVTWTSTIDEVEAWLGERTVTLHQDMGDYGAYAMAAKDGAECLGLDCGRAAAQFYDGDLFSVYCYFTAESLGGDPQALIDRLIGDYGEPEYADPEGTSLLDFINAMTGEAPATKQLCSWRIDEDTHVELFQATEAAKTAEGDPYPYLCELTVANATVEARFNDALTGYLDTED